MNNSKLNNNRFRNLQNNKKNYFMVITLIVVVIIIIILYLFYRNYNFYKMNTPYLVEGSRGGNIPLTIPANRILDSNDTQYGVEMTYAFWIYIKDSNFNNNSKLKHVFHKGSNDYNGELNKYPLLQSPGVWLSDEDNKLIIQFNTYNNNNIYEYANVGNIPLNKWVHITIMLIGNSVDIYINCNLKKRVKLEGVIKNNQGDVHMGYWGGFDGYIAKFRYYNYAIKPFEIDYICSNINTPSNTAPEELLQNSQSYLSPNYWLTTGFPKAVGVPSYVQN